MKKLFLTILSAIMLVMALPFNASAQDYTPQNCEAVISATQAQLPMSIDDDVTWTGLNFADNKTVIVFTFKIGASNMGISLANLKLGFDSMSANDVKGFLGDEFMQMLRGFKKKGRLVILFSDGTKRTFEIEP